MEGVKKYNTEISPMFNLIGKNIEENTQLAQLRDTLLPKLMSGEIDVSKVKIDEILDDSLADKLSFSVYLLHLHWNLNSPGWCYYQSGVSAIGIKAALFQ